MNSNQYKDFLLGMPHGTAANKLRKSILFELVRELGYDTCFQCGEKIETVDHLSIEHKVPWQSSENPVNSFFDLDNIAFSHLTCNTLKTNPRVRVISPEGYSWCYACKLHKPVESFAPGKRFNGLAPRCQDCTNREKRERRIEKLNSPSQGFASLGQ